MVYLKIPVGNEAHEDTTFIPLYNFQKKKEWYDFADIDTDRIELAQLTLTFRLVSLPVAGFN